MTDYRKGVENWNYWNNNEGDFWEMFGMVLLTCFCLVGFLSVVYLSTVR